MSDRPKVPRPDDEGVNIVDGTRVNEKKDGNVVDLPALDLDASFEKDAQLDAEFVEGGAEDVWGAHPLAIKAEKDARRLLGMDVVYKMMSAEEKKKLLPSRERCAAFETIDADTYPRKFRIKEK